MSEHTAQLNMLRGSLIMEELYRLGIRHVCIAPGSRSTPLTLSAAEHGKLTTHIHFDERGLGFFALGCAKATGTPVVLICSSGTAAANFLPAVIEAKMDQVPLIILTADRPGELHHVSANQSIDQHQLFGSYTTVFRELHTPSEQEPPEAVLTLIDDVVAHSQSPESGPVHINCMFREPFVPKIRLEPSTIESLKHWHDSERPYTRQLPMDVSGISSESIKDISTARKGFLIIGRLRSEAEIQSAEALANHLQWPVFADIGSGLRLGTDKPWLIAHFDMLLESSEPPEPDVILHIGGAFLSKPLLHYLKEVSHVPLYQVQGHSRRNNPLHRPITVLKADLPLFVETVQAKAWPESALTDAWLDRETNCAHVVDAECAKGLTGASIASCIAKGIPSNHALFIGNSLSIREMERYAPADYSRPTICINRGASGIDGNIATAAGFATGNAAPLTVLIGDLTALHDLNSLSLLKACDQDVVLIVRNNDGGGIFHKLPIAQQTEHFEDYFATPHGLNFSAAANMFGFTYHAPETVDALEKSYAKCLTGGNHIIEVTTPR